MPIALFNNSELLNMKRKNLRIVKDENLKWCIFGSHVKMTLKIKLTLIG